MSNVNKVILIGNLGRDPDLRYTTAGRAVANLSVATSENWKDNSGEWQQETEWHRVVCWGERAESLHGRLGKGHRIYVEGRLKTRSWENRDGQRQYQTEVHAVRAFPLTAGNGAGGGGLTGAMGGSETPGQPVATGPSGAVEQKDATERSGGKGSAGPAGSAGATGPAGETGQAATAAAGAGSSGGGGKKKKKADDVPF